MSPRSERSSASPWVAQLDPEPPPRPLHGDVATDVAVVGAGIAGVATAFFLLRETDLQVLLIERDRAGRGATGHNAGQLTSYFERPLHDIAREFGDAMAVDAQRDLDGAHDLLDLIVAESGATVRVERFTGHLGLFALDHLEVHLRASAVRRRGGLAVPRCQVSEEAEFIDALAEFDGLYEIVPQHHVDEVLGTAPGTYRAVVAERKGCANSAALVQQVLAHLLERHPDRFRYHDRTSLVRLVVGDDSVTLRTEAGTARARRVVLCTNGYVDHETVGVTGEPIPTAVHHVDGLVGYMAAFFQQRLRPPGATSYVRNDRIGGDVPYVYVTHRTFDRPDGPRTLTCLGGPAEDDVVEGRYDPGMPFPDGALELLRSQALPFAEHDHEPEFDFAWHGLMGYLPDRIRVIGADPRFPHLLYNLGCNGVGFLASVHGGHRIARLVGGEVLPPSIFDPRR